MTVDVTCRSCAEQAARQAEQMAPRTDRAGVAVVANRDAFIWLQDKAADIRIGDIVRVELVAAAVQDAGFCEECDA